MNQESNLTDPSSEQTPRPTGPEASLFEGASEKAKQLFAESKRVRRAADRRLWWQANKPKPNQPEGEGQ